MSAAAKTITNKLRQYGRAMTLRRRVGTTSTYNDVAVYGVDEGYKPTELIGGLQQGDRRVTISNAQLAAQSAFVGAPRKGDFIVIDGVTQSVQGSQPKYLRDEVLAHVLWVRG